VALRDAYLPQNTTFHLDILGGNHAQFGSCDSTNRTAALNSTHGDARIPENVQQELTVGAIAHVASRMGLQLPEWERNSKMPTVSASFKGHRVTLLTAGILLTLNVLI